VKTASEMTYTVSGGALNSAQPTNHHLTPSLEVNPFEFLDEFFYPEN